MWAYDEAEAREIGARRVREGVYVYQERHTGGDYIPEFSFHGDANGWDEQRQRESVARKLFYNQSTPDFDDPSVLHNTDAMGEAADEPIEIVAPTHGDVILLTMATC